MKLGLTGVLLVLSLPAGAQAQAFCDRNLARSARGEAAADFGVGVELAATQRDNERDTQWLWSPRLLLCYRASERVSIEVDWAAAVLNEAGADGTSATTFASSDPMLALRYAVLSDAERSLSLSLGGTAPLAFPDYDAYAGQRRASLAYAAAVRGLWDAYLWAPSQMGAALGAIFEQRLTAFTRLRAEADVAATFSVGDATADAGDVYGQVAAEFIGGDSAFHWALRMQASAFTSESDAAQLALAPYVSATVAEVVLRGQVVVNIDPPLGVYGTGLGLWGVLLSAEVGL